MRIWILKYKGKPVTVSKMLHITREYHSQYNDGDYKFFICAPSKSAVVKEFLSYVGFTWKEWTKDGFTVEMVR